MRAKKERPRPACWTKATELLGQQELSSAKLAEKLRQRGYEAEEIAAVIARLQERRFLNDTEAAARQVNYFYTDERLSMRAIRQKLHERGFTSEDIDAAWPEDREEIDARELRAAKRALRGKKADKGEDKLAQALYRRGFSTSICYRAVKEYIEENSGDDPDEEDN